MNNSNIHSILAMIRKMENDAGEGLTSEPQSDQDKFNNSIVNNMATSFDPDFMSQEQMDADMDLDQGSDFLSFDDEVLDTSPTQPSTEELSNVTPWLDVSSFTNDVMIATSRITDIVYNTERWIGTLDGLEEYEATGQYFIMAMTAVDGLVVSLVYRDLTSAVAVVTIAYKNDTVKILSVEKQ